ncbi:hypothetical protein ACS0TY_020473 [Phlomoides rotata]
METNFADLSIEGVEEDEILLDGGGESEDCNTQDHYLVWRFLTQQTVNYISMKNVLATVWRPMRGVTIRPIGEGRFLFQFFHILDVNRVLTGSPWFFNNHPLILHLLRKGEHPHQVPLNRLPIWVQVYDLPHGFISERVGIQLGNFFGKFMEYGKSNLGAAWLSYVRIKVEIETSNPLKRWKRIAQKNGESFLVHFKYEKLGIFCFVCGHLGHMENFYEVRYLSSEVEPKREWGPFLRAPKRGGRKVVLNRWLRGPMTGGSSEGLGQTVDEAMGQGVAAGGQFNLVVSVVGVGADGGDVLREDSVDGSCDGVLEDVEAKRKRKMVKMLLNASHADMVTVAPLHDNQMLGADDGLSEDQSLIVLTAGPHLGLAKSDDCVELEL